MAHQHTILVVEDDDNFRQTLTWALEARQWRVIAAASGAEALAKLGAEPQAVCAILLDATLPDMPIRQVCSEIGRVTPATPLIVMSGDSLGDVQERARVNPRRFLAKPFDLSALYGTLSASMTA